MGVNLGPFRRITAVTWADDWKTGSCITRQDPKPFLTAFDPTDSLCDDTLIGTSDTNAPAFLEWARVRFSRLDTAPPPDVNILDIRNWTLTGVDSGTVVDLSAFPSSANCNKTDGDDESVNYILGATVTGDVTGGKYYDLWWSARWRPNALDPPGPPGELQIALNRYDGAAAWDIDFTLNEDVIASNVA